MIDGLVLVEVAQRRADAALRRAGMAASRVEFADDGYISAAFAGIQGGHQTRAAGADDNRIVFVNFHRFPRPDYSLPSFKKASSSGGASWPRSS